MNDTMARHKALVDGVAKATGMSRFLNKLKRKKEMQNGG
jgi:hypothetical protein